MINEVERSWCGCCTLSTAEPWARSSTIPERCLIVLGACWLLPTSPLHDSIMLKPRAGPCDERPPLVECSTRYQRTNEHTYRELQHWDLKYATPTAAFTHHVRDAEQRAMVEIIFRKFELEVLPSMTSFRSSVIHGDANDLNVLVPPRTDADGAPLDIEPPQRVIGLIDFGDVVHSYTVFNVAIALAYVVQRKSDPMTAACHVLTAYHKLFPLTEREIEGILSS